METSFITDSYRYADLFTRPRTDLTLLGSDSERLFALCPSGWAFSGDGFYQAGRMASFHIDAQVRVNGQEIRHEQELYHAWGDELSAACEGVCLTGWRFISPDDCACFVLSAVNEGTEAAEVTLRIDMPEMRCGYGEVFTDEYDCCSFMGMGGNLQVETDGEGGQFFSGKRRLQPGEEIVFRAAIACAADRIDCEEALNAFLTAEDPVRRQTEAVETRYRENIPYFECSDEAMTRTWYFRWQVYLNQVRRTAAGFRVVTEFIRNVEWAGRYNTIVCPAGHHMREGRWLRDGGVMDDYARFWVELSGEGGRSYTSWTADSLLNIAWATGRFDYAVQKVRKLAAIYRHLCHTPYGLRRREAGYRSYLAENGLFRQIDSHDGGEFSISGRPWRYDRPRADYRPQVNACMYGEANAIAVLAEMAGDEKLAEEFRREAERIARRTDEALWDEKTGFYKTVNSETGEMGDVCETKGYFPWYFDMPGTEKDCAWSKLDDEAYFKAPAGIGTAQRSHPHYMRDMNGERWGESGPACVWNGTIWPFETSMVLTGLMNRINRADGGTEEMRRMWMENMRIYARSHDKDGYPWLGESQDPETGAWNFERDYGLNYNHSSYCDLIITGLVGLRPQAGDGVCIHPIASEGEMDWFCLENVPYHGRLLTIVYDRDGSRYGRGAGMILYVDGQEVMRRDRLGQMEYML